MTTASATLLPVQLMLYSFVTQNTSSVKRERETKEPVILFEKKK